MIGALVALVALLASLDSAHADPACALPPIGLDSALDEGGAGIILTWQASPCDPDRYAIYRRDMNDAGARMLRHATVPGDALSYLDADVSAGVTYRYRVRSNDSGRRSDFADITTPSASRASQASTDAELSALSLSPGTLDPAFDRMTDSYTASVEHLQSPITLIATASDPVNAKVEFLDGDDMPLADADGNTAGHQVDLAVGENTSKIKVTAEDGLTTRTYTLVVTRAGPNTDLSDLRVNGVSVPGFDSDVKYKSSGVQRGVAASVAQATIEGVTDDPDAAVAYLGTDADEMTDGHQVNLSEGRNELSIVVTAADGVTTRTYLLSVNRGSDAPFGWRAQDDFDTLVAAGNNSPVGLWSDGTTMWVAEDHDPLERLFAYARDTRLRDPDKDFKTLRAASNTNVRGIWSDGMTMWVADSFDEKLYGYAMDTRRRESGKDINRLGQDGNGDPGDIWSDGETIWVVDKSDPKLYAYRLATGERDSAKDFNTLAGDHSAPNAIWSDRTTTWIGDSEKEELYAYDLATGKRDPGSDFNTLKAVGNTHIRYIWSDGTIMWVSDRRDGKLYAYNMPGNADLSGLSLSAGTLEPAFHRVTTSYAASAPNAVSTITVIALASDAGQATVEFLDASDETLADADLNTAGHQVALAPGENTIKIKATAEDGATTRTYTLVVTRQGPLEVSFGSSSFRVAEGGSLTVTAALERATERDVAVPLIVTAGSGVSDDDYSGVPENLIFARGSLFASFSFKAEGDVVVEDDEVVTVSFDTLPDGLTAGTPTTTTVTITDDDEPSWALSVAPVSIAEASESSATVSVSSGGVTFTSARTISLGFRGSATENTDYTVTTRTLTLAVGQDEVSTTVVALDDDVSDAGERILVRATLDGARIGARQTITIADDDEAAGGIALGVAPTRVGEDAGRTTLTVTGTLDGSALTTDTVVSLTLAAGTATATTDYTVSSNTATLTIPAASTSGTASFRLTPVDDVIDDDDETVTIEASTTSALTLSPSSLTVTISDDDEPNTAPVFQPPSPTRSVDENSAAGVAVGAPVTAIDADNDRLRYSLAGAGATAFRIDAASGQLRTVSGVDYDHEAADRYTVTVIADDLRGGVGRASVTIHVSDLDEPPPAPAAPAVSPTRGATDSLDVSWTAPSTAGRPAISGYELRYRSGGGAWAGWAHPGTGIVATISGLIADTSYEVQVRAGNDEGASGWSAGEGSTYSEEDLCSAAGPAPTLVAVTSVPIMVASTANVYFVLYVTHELDGAEIWTPVSVTRGNAGSTTLAEQVSPLPASRYRVERYSVSDPADIDGDCIDDLAELDALGRMNPLNPAPQIAITDGATAIPDRSTFETLAFSEQTAEHEYVKFALLDMDTDEPLLYWINSKTHRRHPIAFFLETIGHKGPHLPWSIPGEVVYDPNLTATDGARGVYYFWLLNYDARFTPAFLERVYALLSSAMPLLDDDLPMYIPNRRLGSYRADLDTLRNSRIPLLFNEDVFGDVDFLALNHGVGYGRLRVMAPGERPNPRNVVIYETLPNELPRVAGIITGVPQTPLSHVNLRAVQDGVPNAYIKEPLEDDEIDDLVDRFVRYEVTAEGYELRAAAKDEVDAHFARSRPAHVQTPERDLTVTAISALREIGFGDWKAFGVKAANVAELGKLGFPEGAVPDGFAIPFYFYDEFMQHTALGEETVFGKGKGADEDKFTLPAETKLIDAAKAILAHPQFQTDFEIQDEMLDDLRDAIEDAQSPQWIIDALTAMHAMYPEGQSLRYRSSTNNEDLPGFSGAGLYDSNTQKPDETVEDGIDKSLKQVFASLWNFRAFTEREFHRIDHLATAMGVLVHPNYSDERANGVAVSFDPIRGYSNYYYLNTQLGEDLVTNPEADSEPEEILLHRSGDFYEVLATSNQIEPGALLMTDLQMKQLAEHLTVIHDHFARLYPARPYAIEIEFKITEADILAIKQARPWVYTIEAPVRVSFEQTSFTAPEGASASIVVSLSAPSGPFGITIPIVVTGGTASADEYIAPEPVVFSSGEDRQTVSIALGDDALIEGNETIALAFGDLPTGVTSGTNSTTTVTITDADSAGFKFAISDDEVGEGATVELTVTLDGDATFATAQTIDLTFPGGAATAGVDFTVADARGQTLTAPYALTLPAGSSSVAATISIVDDAEEEGNETIVVRAWHGADALGGLQVITILANDEPIVGNSPPVFTEGRSAARSLAENTGPSINIGRPLAATDIDQGDALTYSLGGPDAGSFDISLASGQLRTKSGVVYDHEARSSYRVPVTVSDGEDTATIDVDIAVTDVDEPPDAPVVQVDTASPVSLNVTWMAPATSGRPAVSNYDLRYKLDSETGFVDGPQDVSGTSASIGELIPASSYDVQVRATNAEGDGAWSASQPGETAVLPVVTLILSESSIPENRGMSTVTATVSPASPTPFSVEIWAAAFPPFPGQFETSLNTILSFAANETQSTGEVVITGLVAAVVNVSGAVSPAGVLVKPPARVQLRITDVDPEVTVRFGSAAYNVPEGGIRRVSVVLDEDPERTVVIPITRANQGGAVAGDYSVAPDPTNVTFTAGGGLTQTFTFTAVEDTFNDDGESVLLGFGAITDTRVTVGTPSRSTVSITDDDDPEVTVQFKETSYTATEGGTVATVTVEISVDPERSLEIPIRAAGANGATGLDFGRSAVFVTFTAGGGLTRTFTVTATNDTADDDGETVELTFGAMPDTRVTPDPDGNTTATVDLVDDDDPEVTVKFGASSINVDEGNSATITVTISADPKRRLTIPIMKVNGNGASDADYAGVLASVTFESGGAPMQTFTFRATQDDIDDGEPSDNEHVTLGFGTMPDMRVTADSPMTQTITIGDDDKRGVTVTPLTLSVNEDGDDDYEVVLTSQPTAAVTVTPGTTSTEVTLSGALRFRPGNWGTPQTVTVTAPADADTVNETLTITHTAIGGDYGTVKPASVAVRLRDNDTASIAISTSGLTIDEGQTARFTVKLNTEPDNDVTVTITSGNPAVATVRSDSLTFTTGDWSTEQDVTVMAADDDGAADNDTMISFEVSGYGSVTTAAPITVSVEDDDTRAVFIDPPTLEITEGFDDAYSVSLRTEPSGAVTVQVAGHAGTDVKVMPDSLTFTSSDWTVPQAVTVTTAEDEDADNDTVTLTHSVSGYGTVTTAEDVVVTIVERDEEGITVTDVTPPLEDPNEGDAPATGTYTVVLDTQPSGDVMVAITSNNADVTVMPESLTFTTSDWNQPQTVTVTAAGDADATDDTATLTHKASGSDYSATATVTVTVTDLDDAPTTSTGSGGGGGGGGPSGPSPSKVEFEWTVTRDIEQLDSGHDAPTGAWSDGTLLWLAENGDGADDAVYAYDLATGERVEEREFELDARNRAPRGLWSNGKTAWVADSGQDRLFAYDLESGERDEEREVELDPRNRDPRGIWSEGTTVWVLDGGKNALFAYDLATGELIAEYALDSTNNDPRGLWSDGVTIWVSDHGAKRLFAYRIVAQDTETATGEDEEAAPLERVRDEEFTELSRASNNSPRGIWSDGDVMYVADESDGKVYSYNLPDAIDARLASLTLSGVEFGEFDPSRTDYEGIVAEGVTGTTIEAGAVQRRTDVAIHPPDDDDANGHQVSLQGATEITVTVTSQDGTLRRVYRVAIGLPVRELQLNPAWTPFEWPGREGAGISEALREAGTFEEVLVVYQWDDPSQTWMAFFPGLEAVPGLNTLTTLTTGRTYWVAVSEPLTWTVATP